MIELNPALAIIREVVRPLPPVTVPLADAPGHRLAQDIYSDIDSPPFDKSMMDGIAIRFVDWFEGTRVFESVGEIRAGTTEQPYVGPGQAVRIMTGGRMPPGADTVVMVEETRDAPDPDSKRIEVTAPHCRPAQNVMTRATTVAKGQKVLPGGHWVRPYDIGTLAEAGAATCTIHPRPTVTVLATGDELVAVDARPRNSQIRNSNGPMLVALARPWCREVRDAGIAQDSLDRLTEMITAGMESDVLILSGGVSAGTADLVPAALERAGVRQHFHKVAIKPGKPVWFGQGTGSGGRSTFVFGLPGNPVSSLVCFRLLVRTCLNLLAGGTGVVDYRSAKLASGLRQRPGRTTFWPSRILDVAEPDTIQLLDWKGSADLLTLCEANCLAVLPGDRDSFADGETVRMVPLD